MLRIFLSYAHEDGRDEAKALERLLDELGYRVWLDIKGIPLGEEWRAHLSAGLRETDVVLVLLTPEALKSDYVSFEWRTALDKEKLVIPVFVSTREVPNELGRIQGCDLMVEPPMAGVGRLVTRLSELVTECLNEVREEAERMAEEQAYAPLRPALEKLGFWASARSYAPEIFRAALWLVRRMKEEARDEHDIAELMERLIRGEYAVKDDWEISGVFRRNKDIFQGIFSNLLRELRKGKSFAVPVVLLVMNDAEAASLESEEAFQGCPRRLRQDFKRLRTLLRRNGLDDWRQRYRETPEAWQPFSSAEGAESISQLITRSLNNVGGDSQQFIPSFKDVRTLTADENRQLLRDLRHEGCVVVVDLISIHHPAIQRHFQRSALDYYQQTSVVTVAPFSSAFDVLREMTVVLQMKVSEMEFAMRRLDVDARSVDYGACEQIHEEGVLLVWLLDRVKKMYLSRASAETGIRGYIFLLIGVQS